MGRKSQVPKSFFDLTPAIEREFCELIRETAVIKTDGEEVPTPVVWDMTKALYTDDVPWTIRRIPKRRGFRTIHAPKDPLMAISRGILHHILRRIPVHKVVHGCEPRTSMITNARVHAGVSQALYNVDLKDAFPSTTRDRLVGNLGPKIKRVLVESTDLEPDEADILVAVLLDLMLVDDRLPQGFPTSPGVLSIVMMPVDKVLSKYMKLLRAETGAQWHYTRYVDDLTFSTDLDRIPKEVRSQIRKIIRKQGWKINSSKLAYCGNVDETGDPELSTKAPVVTGMIINDDGRLTVAPRKLKRWRARMNEWLAQDELTDEQRKQLNGMVNFLSMVYDGDLPSAVRQVYLRCKEKFNIRDAQTRRDRFPESGYGSGE